VRDICGRPHVISSVRFCFVLPRNRHYTSNIRRVCYKREQMPQGFTSPCSGAHCIGDSNWQLENTTAQVHPHQCLLISEAYDGYHDVGRHMWWMGDEQLKTKQLKTSN